MKSAEFITEDCQLREDIAVSNDSPFSNNDVFDIVKADRNAQWQTVSGSELLAVMDQIWGNAN
jgi:hypothetical protein